MKDFDKNKELSYLKYWDVNNLYGLTMYQTFPGNDFKWVEDIFKFNEHFVKSYSDESDEGQFLEVDVQDPETSQKLHNYLLFLPERIKIENKH